MNAELAELPAPDLDDPKTEVVGLFREFERTLSKHIEGLQPNDDITSLGLMHQVNSTFERFKEQVRLTAPKFCPWSSQAVLDRQSEEDMVQAASQYDTPGLWIKERRRWYVDEVMELARR